jgi:hypothetical protein
MNTRFIHGLWYGWAICEHTDPKSFVCLHEECGQISRGEGFAKVDVAGSNPVSRSPKKCRSVEWLFAYFWFVHPTYL